MGRSHYNPWFLILYGGFRLSRSLPFARPSTPTNRFFISGIPIYTLSKCGRNPGREYRTRTPPEHSRWRSVGEYLGRIEA
ncbi:hypothetical protein F5Y04DRAFT_260952 [Hypomontagnella monticulosa]|nr:hypothetical protein F5Y04DRAFT_260952 [Hypomontagnella monticulosa]